MTQAQAESETVYHFEWRLRASPAKLWPYVSDTQRVNEALGLPPWNFVERRSDDGSVRRDGSARQLGLNIEWEEKPFEWTAGREMAVERIYSTGPIRRMTFRLRLENDPAPAGGTIVRLTLGFDPRGAAFALVARAEIGVRMRWRFESVYRRIDAYIAGEQPSAFEPVTPDISGSVRGKLRDELRPRLVLSDGFEPELVAKLLTHVQEADDRSLARMRPFELADRWERDRATVLRLFLRATGRGLLTMGWDILCPYCRGAKVRVEELPKLQGEAHCSSCDVKFDTRAERAVELVFTPSPSVRRVEPRTFCVGGPGNTPHVLLQRRLAPGAKLSLPIELEPGTYRVRGPGVTKAAHVTARAGETPPASTTLTVKGDALAPADSQLRATGAELELANQDAVERVLLVERIAWHDDAVTVAHATTFDEFRRLFPGQVPPPSVHLSVGRIAIAAVALSTQKALADLEPDELYLVVPALRATLREAVARRGGAFAPIPAAAGRDHETFVGAFVNPADAVRAVAELVSAATAFASDRGLGSLNARAGIDAGLCVAASREGGLEHQGPPLQGALAMLELASPGEIVLDARLREESEVAIAVGQAKLSATAFEGQVQNERRKLERLIPDGVEARSKTVTHDDIVRWEQLELGDPLGAGGSATVRIARRKSDGQRYAVKVFTARGEKARTRFEREVRALERLIRLPHVVGVRGYGTNGSSCWIAMDLIEGRSLGEKVRKEQRLHVAEAAKLIATVARAVGQAHSLGVLHRDIKPDNVVLDQKGEPWVLDFGIARMDGESAITTEGFVSGTLAYIAPEAFAKGGNVDGRADIYALGATFYELVGGQPPFDDPSVPALVARILNDPVPDLRTVAPEAGEHAAAVAAHALAKAPEQRYATAAALAIDLERLAAGEPPLEAGLAARGGGLTRVLKKMFGLG